jgi:hypothetical protein
MFQPKQMTIDPVWTYPGNGKDVGIHSVGSQTKRKQGPKYQITSWH